MHRAGRRDIFLQIYLGYLFAAGLCAGVAWAETIHLKTRSLETSEDIAAHRVGPLKRRHPDRSHYLIQFRSRPSAENLKQVERRGGMILGYVPDSALVVSGSDDIAWEGLGLKWVGRLRDVDKISPVLADTSSEDDDADMFVVVDFHPDVDMEEARQLVAEHNLSVVERDGLLPDQLLVSGPLSRVMRLPEWDEVAYIFPASDELINGETVWACAGAITEQGPIGNYVKMGSGWPKPSSGPVQLGYIFGALTQKIPAGTAQSEIVRALTEWTKYGNVKFNPATSATALETLYIFFASGAHGDSYPFDGPGGVLAHTFYPAPPNSEPIAGDMHLDADESWHAGSSIDLFSVALHEAGHALGLGHSDLPTAVMYPFYRQTVGLSPDDIAGIQSLYGAAGANPPVAPPATPPPSSPLSLAVTSPSAPAVTTSAASMAMSGTASGGKGSLTVSWRNDRGGSGTAIGAANWSVAAAPLSTGDNHITVTVADGAGGRASQSITVTRTAQADNVAPSLQITSPAGTIVQTSASTITIIGNASDNVGVTAVRWSTAIAHGDAEDTTSWRIDNLPLLVGTNTITVRAYDAAGNSGWRSLKVVRR